MTVLAAIEASGLLAEFPEIATRALVAGIHGQVVDPHREVRAGERVEIYRPLQADPREARRQRLSPPGGRRAGPARR
jgi:putative ubiquitin-RnfH superfamily antitoxin RatB of RatAB toxin-antitoxin module